jgi:hypothetical protein
MGLELVTPAALDFQDGLETRAEGAVIEEGHGWVEGLFGGR